VKTLDRRTFLTSAAATAAALNHTSLWPELAAAQAAAVDGVPRGLLTGAFSAISGDLTGPGAWNPYPRAGEAGWSKLPPQVRDVIVSRADAANSAAWTEMLATEEL
jgi:hypothetical protein